MDRCALTSQLVAIVLVVLRLVWQRVDGFDRFLEPPALIGEIGELVLPTSERRLHMLGDPVRGVEDDPHRATSASCCRYNARDHAR